jgi:hypothetical protein
MFLYIDFKINVLGLCICSREAVKSMRERGVDDGHIVLMSRYVCFCCQLVRDKIITSERASSNLPTRQLVLNLTTDLIEYLKP